MTTYYIKMAFLLAVLWPRCFCMWKKCSCRISTCNTWSGVTGRRRTVHLEVWCWVRHPKRLLSNISLLCFDNMLGFLSSWVDSWVELLIKWIEAGSTTKWWGPWCKALYWCSLSHPIKTHRVSNGHDWLMKTCGVLTLLSTFSTSIPCLDKQNLWHNPR